jgi:hypothetical protein
MWILLYKLFRHHGEFIWLFIYGMAGRYNLLCYPYATYSTQSSSHDTQQAADLLSPDLKGFFFTSGSHQSL